MSNPYFQFKKFIVHQEGAPLKVTTDACLFGALIETENATSILDIGTGTGLLVLMLAQKSDASCILGIEVDKRTAELAETNFSGSSWKEKTKSLQSDIFSWSEHADSKFDLIVCNPPFFSSSMKNEDERKSLARHNDSLSHKNLTIILSKHLTKNGKAFIMLPPNEMIAFENYCSIQNLFPEKKFVISSNEGKSPHLFIISFLFNPENFSEEKIFIHEKDGKYTERFMELLAPYYLHL
ncbi:MAG: methyltransferase [Bacteroidota bacterium]